MSPTFTLCVAVAVLPQLSVAIQVLTITKLLAQLPGSFVSLSSIATLGSQLSTAVTLAAKGATSSHSTVSSAGIPARTGGVVSPTLILCSAEVTLPQSSVAVQVLIITYASAQAPLFSIISVNSTNGLASQLSETITSLAPFEFGI